MSAVILFYILLAFFWALVALWATAFFWTCRAVAFFKPVTRKAMGRRADKPKISVLLPARNEEKRVLKECVDSLLAQNYENFEVIAVNDCSTDQTGEILRQFAAQNSNVRFIEGKELPVNWLGKPFVLEQALEKAAGEWILTTDADVIFRSPKALSAALDYAEENNLEALCLIPFVICQSFWEIVFMPIFNWFRLLAMPPHRVNDQTRLDAMGIGNFFFVRRAALEKIGNFAAVKNDVAEDLRLAEILKRNGLHIKTEYAPDLIETRMYSSFGEIWHGFTKNFFAGSKFSIKKALFGIVTIVLYGVLPSIAALFCFIAWTLTADNAYLLFFVPLAVIYFLQTMLFGFLHVRWKLPPVYALLAPVGLMLFAVILANSTFKIVSGRGVTWKERSIYNCENRPSSVG